MGLDPHFDNDMKFKLTELDTLSGIIIIIIIIIIDIVLILF